MVRNKSVMLWILAVITLMSCAASERVEHGSSEQRRDSVVVVVKDSVAKSEARTNSSAVIVKDESHTTGTMTDKGSNEETITERVTESVDASGNKTTTTDRTIYRKGDYERNDTYDARLKHQEDAISRMQHLIDSMAFSNRLDVGTHLAKKDSTNVQKETNTKDIKPASIFEPIFFVIISMVVVGMAVWLFNKL